MKLNNALPISLVAAALACSPVAAQKPAAPDPAAATQRDNPNANRVEPAQIPPSPQERLSDRQFVERATELTHAEIAGAQLALTKSTDPAVRTFAQMLSRDHAAANKELRRLAEQEKITLPDFTAPAGQGANPRPDMPSSMSDLVDLNGKEFDRAYVAREVKDFQEAVDLFEREIAGSANADLKAFAQRTLPTLQKHLKEAATLHNRS